ncbi:MAG: hypothetical protein ACD_26C00073G0003 [uncultured bacterium]|nr:MAG: hypothetical protein ACD_26C00073G0003 [uncultured bacterium]
MQYAETWYNGNYTRILYKNAQNSSQRIGEFLKLLGSERIHRKFFKEYIEKTYEDTRGILVDSTGLPDEINFPFSAWGVTTKEKVNKKQDCLWLLI